MSFYKHYRKEYLLVLLLTFVKIALHFLANSNYGFHRDELLYLALGEHLNWGFSEVPPFIAGVAWVSSAVFGDSVFGARIISTVFGSLIVYLTGLTVLTLGGKRLAIFLACAAVMLSPAFLASGYLLQPVVFDQFFWLLSAYLIISYLKTRQTAYLIGLGFTAGFGMLNKYTLALYLAALIVALLLSPRRKLLLNKSWLLAALIALILFLPNLLWQVNHQLPVIRHMAELNETQLINIKPADFLFEQLLIHAATGVVWLCGFFYLLVSGSLKKYRFLAFAYLLVIAMLIFLHGKSYYSFGAYPVLFAVGGIALSRILSPVTPMLRYALLLLIFVPNILFIPIAIPLLPFNSTLQFFDFSAKKLGLKFPLKWEDQKMHATTQDYADMLGWEELARGAAEAYIRVPSGKRSVTTIFANNYGQAGAIDHYRRKYGLPPAVCLNSSYALWSPEEINPEFFITIDDEYPDDLQEYFNKIEKIAEVKNIYAREKGTAVYLLSQPLKPLNPLYKKHRHEELN